MRRLPVYFLIDVSESMVGEPIQKVEEGLSMIIQSLKKDPHALETVWVSIIIFAGQAKTLVPLSDIISFYPPKFPIGSGTSLSKGLGHLMFELRKNTVKTTIEKKGDWKPIIFLLTDGIPTDDTQIAISEWKQNWKRSTNMVAVSFNDYTDIKLLSELTDNVLNFNTSEENSYKHFFKWVTDSIKTSSVNVEKNTAENSFELVKIESDVISKIDLSKNRGATQLIDNNFVVLSAKCQNSKRPYLIKYRKVVSSADFGGVELDTLSYQLTGAFQVDNSYFELSDKTDGNFKINTEELIGVPSCPCCGNQNAFAVCSCKKLHCIGSEIENTCPWCGSQGSYGFSEGGFDVNRTQG